VIGFWARAGLLVRVGLVGTVGPEVVGVVAGNEISAGAEGGPIRDGSAFDAEAGFAGLVIDLIVTAVAAPTASTARITSVVTQRGRRDCFSVTGTPLLRYAASSMGR
jgi:hypothetical protein